MDDDAEYDKGDSSSSYTCFIIFSPQHRSAAGVVQLLGKMYALGGHNGLSIFDSVEEYDTQTECWAETVPMLSKRCRLGVGSSQSHDGTNNQQMWIGGDPGWEDLRMWRLRWLLLSPLCRVL